MFLANQQSIGIALQITSIMDFDLKVIALNNDVIHNSFLNQNPYHQNRFVMDNAAEHCDLETHYGIFTYMATIKEIRKRKPNCSNFNKVKLSHGTAYKKVFLISDGNLSKWKSVAR